MENPWPGLRVEVSPQHLEHPVLQFFLNYWNRKRGDRLMPSRADLIFSQLRGNMVWMALLDVLPDNEFRYRLIGTKVAQYYLTNSTGKTLSAAYPPEFKNLVEEIRRGLRVCATRRIVIRTFGDFDPRLQECYLNFDNLFMPLSDDGEIVNMILNIFTYDSLLFQDRIAKAGTVRRVNNAA